MTADYRAWADSHLRFVRADDTDLQRIERRLTGIGFALLALTEQPARIPYATAKTEAYEQPNGGSDACPICGLTGGKHYPGDGHS